LYAASAYAIKQWAMLRAEVLHRFNSTIRLALTTYAVWLK